MGYTSLRWSRQPVSTATEMVQTSRHFKRPSGYRLHRRRGLFCHYSQQWQYVPSNLGTTESEPAAKPVGGRLLVGRRRQFVAEQPGAAARRLVTTHIDAQHYFFTCLGVDGRGSTYLPRLRQKAADSLTGGRQSFEAVETGS